MGHPVLWIFRILWANSRSPETSAIFFQLIIFCPQSVPPEFVQIHSGFTNRVVFLRPAVNWNRLPFDVVLELLLFVMRLV